jgi:hypothetical protein
MWHSLSRKRVRNDRETLITGLVPSADRRAGRQPVQITGAWTSGRGPRAHVFGLHGRIMICLLYKLTFSDQAQVLQLRVSLSDIA